MKSNIFGIDIPSNTKAILWDMDGVIIDSLEYSLTICSKLLSCQTGYRIQIPEEIIKKNFAFSHEDFWRKILLDLKLNINDVNFENLLFKYEKGRKNYPYKLLPGIQSLILAAKKSGIRQAVVSSNSQELIESIITDQGLQDNFEAYIGYDSLDPVSGIQSHRKKPFPDLYKVALNTLQISSSESVAIEDSTIGLKAALSAGCYCIGVATGPDSVSALEPVIPKDNGYVLDNFLI